MWCPEVRTKEKDQCDPKSPKKAQQRRGGAHFGLNGQGLLIPFWCLPWKK